MILDKVLHWLRYGTFPLRVNTLRVVFRTDEDHYVCDRIAAYLIMHNVSFRCRHEGRAVVFVTFSDINLEEVKNKVQNWIRERN